MHLTKQDVRGIANYVRIGLTDDMIEEMTQDLNKIIDSLEPITHYDLEGVEPTFYPNENLKNIMREDVAKPGFTQEEALANASASEKGSYKIPPILFDGGGDR